MDGLTGRGGEGKGGEGTGREGRGGLPKLQLALETQRLQLHASSGLGDADLWPGGKGKDI